MFKAKNDDEESISEASSSLCSVNDQKNEKLNLLVFNKVIKEESEHDPEATPSTVKSPKSPYMDKFSSKLSRKDASKLTQK